MSMEEEAIKLNPANEMTTDIMNIMTFSFRLIWIFLSCPTLYRRKSGKKVYYFYKINYFFKKELPGESRTNPSSLSAARSRGYQCKMDSQSSSAEMKITFSDF